ncbi:hypothetical protein [Stenotrophomonas maltophilia]|uniref:hypothetical protein n=1 Tax=Stenotrophomonas maltophilia TaxID=40324 RepID=UPI0020376856|nr:hypothetical protein [Stenotrophomonas maltophilia]
MDEPSSLVSKYSPEAAERLNASARALPSRVTELLLELMKLSQIARPEAREYVSFGVGRRLHTMLEAATEVFTLIPPSSTRVTRDVLKRATINLQAFLIHTVGIMDNMAWAYLYWHAIEDAIKRNDVDLFKKGTQDKLPTPLVDWLTSKHILDWRDNYLKPYRDALAHRIPPYIPETYSPQEAAELRRLEQLQLEAEKSRNGREAAKLRNQIDALPGHGFVFVYSYAPEQGPVLLHQQILADFETIIEVLKVFITTLSTPPRA